MSPEDYLTAFKFNLKINIKLAHQIQACFKQDPFLAQKSANLIARFLRNVTRVPDRLTTATAAVNWLTALPIWCALLQIFNEVHPCTSDKLVINGDLIFQTTIPT